jgi:hypothetical protein
MFFAALLLGYSLQSSHSVTPLVCGDRDAQTAPMRSASGFVVTIAMRSEDDHGKNTHLCEADYSLKVTRPDGTATAANDFIRSDDEWSRPIEFRIEGFSPDGNRVFLLIEEGHTPSFVQASEYDLQTGIFKDVIIDQRFTKRLSPACAKTLHLTGFSSDGQMILASTPEDGCSTAAQWQLIPGRPRKNGVARPVFPAPVSADTKITPLDPGSAIGP